jgi:hypothetical protein
MNNLNIPFIHWHALARRHPSAFLLAAQLLSLVFYAVFDGNAGGRTLLGIFGILVLILVVWVIAHSPDVQWITWTLVVPAFALSLLSLFYTHPTLLVLASLIEALVYFYATGSLIAYMMKDYLVTLDELFAAGATFTLLAWGFTYAYVACQILFPGSFIGSVDPGQPRTFLELLFFSFTNLSATGISDILPISSPARVLVMLEQFAGIAYMAVVVSRLIGMTIVRYTEKNTP